jgi:hypothetical protein
MGVKTEVGPEYLLEVADTQGVSVSSVRDGHVFVFTKSHLEGMLRPIEANGSDRCVVFVKRHDFTDAN